VADLDLDGGKLTMFRSLHRTKSRRDSEDNLPWLQFRNPKDNWQPGQRLLADTYQILEHAGLSKMRF
jgi:hypothetical protein